MRLGMFRRGLLLFWLMIAAMGTSTVVHARELSGARDLECSGYVHSEGDLDQSPDGSDQSQTGSDKAIQHHGHCSGTAACLPRAYGAPLTVVLPAPNLCFGNEQMMGRWTPGPALRPPIA